MKMNKLFIVVIVMSLVLIGGCSNKVVNEGNEIVVEKRVGENNKYELFNEVIDNGEVQKAKEILGKVKWENVVVDMVRPADYKFYFKVSNESESKGLIYHLWISPNKDKVELSIEGEGKYIQLSTENSAELFRIIAGKNLTEISTN